MFNQEHDSILPQKSQVRIGSSTERNGLQNTYALPRCEAKPHGPDGEQCWHHAEVPYENYAGDIKMICKQCEKRVYGAMLALDALHRFEEAAS